MHSSMFVHNRLRNSSWFPTYLSLSWFKHFEMDEKWITDQNVLFSWMFNKFFVRNSKKKNLNLQLFCGNQNHQAHSFIIQQNCVVLASISMISLDSWDISYKWRFIPLAFIHLNNLLFFCETQIIDPKMHPFFCDCYCCWECVKGLILILSCFEMVLLLFLLLLLFLYFLLYCCLVWRITLVFFFTFSLKTIVLAINNIKKLLEIYVSKETLVSRFYDVRFFVLR